VLALRRAHDPLHPTVRTLRLGPGLPLALALPDAEAARAALLDLAQTQAALWAERADGSVWLERRPEQGIWGGLQCLPVFESMEQLIEALPPRLRAQIREQPGFKHVLTHRDLHLHPVQLSLDGRQGRTLLPQGQWWPPQALAALGLPTPVRKLLASLD
jgi:A/G-specific adenine glycosylase